MCGEKVVSTLSCLTAVGSPPRVRGKVHASRHRHGWPGITPACAGKRAFVVDGSGYTRDHPRVCGEKSLIFSARLQEQGSPPRVRGKAPVLNVKVRDGGITPACAGKSRNIDIRIIFHEDHPRVCGEKYQKQDD